MYRTRFYSMISLQIFHHCAKSTKLAVISNIPILNSSITMDQRQLCEHDLNNVSPFVYQISVSLNNATDSCICLQTNPLKFDGVFISKWALAFMNLKHGKN